MNSFPNLNTALMYMLGLPVAGWFAHKLLRLQGTQIGRGIVLGSGVVLVRSGVGTVIDNETVVGDRVRIFHQVTVGRAHAVDPRVSPDERVLIEDDVVIGVGAKILCQPGSTLVIRRGSTIGANAVLTRSTGEGETWVGVPARPVARH